MISLGAFVFHRWALSFFKLAIFRFPDYISLDEESALRLRVLPVEYVYGVELFRTFERSMRGGVVPNK